MLLKLVLRNSFRSRLRTALTICGVCVAVLAFGLLRTVITAWYAGVKASAANRLVTRNAISLVFPLPLSYASKIWSVPGVTKVTYGNWFGGYYRQRKNFFANFAVEANSYLELYPEFVLPAEQKEAFLRDRKACIVGRKLADRFGWRLGDTIPLKGTIFPGDWNFVLRGIYRGCDENVDETQLFFHWDYLNERLKKIHSQRADHVGFYITGVANPDLAPEIARAIDAMFTNSYAQTLTETEKAFQMGFVSMSEAILMAIRLVSLVIIAIIMIVAANSMAMSARERTDDYVVLKTVGFGGPYLAGLILGESLLITCLGGGLGMALTYPAVSIFARAVGQYFPVLQITPQTLYLEAAAVVAIGMVAAIFPAWRVSRLPVAEGLRRIG